MSSIQVKGKILDMSTLQTVVRSRNRSSYIIIASRQTGHAYKSYSTKESSFTCRGLQRNQELEEDERVAISVIYIYFSPALHRLLTLQSANMLMWMAFFLFFGSKHYWCGCDEILFLFLRLAVTKTMALTLVLVATLIRQDSDDRGQRRWSDEGPIRGRGRYLAPS